MEEQNEAQINQRVMELTSEVAAAKRLLWALIYTQGGSVNIPDRIMAMANDDSNSLNAHYNPGAKMTVMKIETEQKRIIS